MIRERILARITWLLVLVWSKTVKFQIVNQEVRERMAAKGQNCIYAFWHGSLLMLLQSHHDSRLVIPVSESKDGNIVARVITYFGFETARGSSKRKGHKALFSLITKMRQGKNVGISVDGPRGPLHRVKPGAVFLAGASHAPIIPVATAAKRFWTLEKSWDKHTVPVPFTTGLIMFGEPLYVNGTAEEELAACQRHLEAELQRLTEAAEVRMACSSEMVLPQTMQSGRY